jgi:hypothetical protein
MGKNPTNEMGKVIEWGKSKKKNQKTATGIRSIVCYARLCYKKKIKKYYFYF